MNVNSTALVCPDLVLLSTAHAYTHSGRARSLRAIRYGPLLAEEIRLKPREVSHLSLFCWCNKYSVNRIIVFVIIVIVDIIVIIIIITTVTSRV